MLREGRANFERTAVILRSNGFQSLSLSKGQIAAVALAIVITFGLLVFALWYACIRRPANRRKRKLQQNREASGIRMSGGGEPPMRMAKRSQDDDDDRSFMSESTLHGDGPTVPLVAAGGGEERQAAAARRYGQPISWSGTGSGGQYGRI